jgi:hypothetical protein
MPRTVGAHEARTHLSELLDEVAGGETIRKMREFQEQTGATPGDLTIREYIEEGRRY